MTIEELWNLPANQFNDWRRQNDLKQLFQHFEELLPEFQSWKTRFGLSVEYILCTDQPGKFFFGKHEKAIIIDNGNEFQRHIFIDIWSEQIRKDIVLQAEPIFFEPYVSWAARQTKTLKVIPGGFAGDREDFMYRQYTNSSPEQSQAILCTGFQVLKMGGIEINGFLYLQGRNLDFCNLDYLSIKGDGICLSRQSEICYASIRYLSIEAEGKFFHFVGCQFEKLRVNKSNLYGFTFEKCDIWGVDFRDSRISDFIFRRSPMSLLNFSQLSIARWEFIPALDGYGSGKGGAHSSNAEIYKCLRILFQSNGMRREAADAYYGERKQEMLAHAHRLDFFALFKNFEWAYRRQRLRFFQTQTKNFFATFGSFISYVLWGFGERPGRIFVSALITIFIYSLLFCISDISAVSGNFFDSLYLSIVTFTTLGFGDITPKDSSTASKMIVASEALMGAFMIGLFVAGYSNKSKY